MEGRCEQCSVCMSPCYTEKTGFYSHEGPEKSKFTEGNFTQEASCWAETGAQVSPNFQPIVSHFSHHCLIYNTRNAILKVQKLKKKNPFYRAFKTRKIVGEVTEFNESHEH